MSKIGPNPKSACAWGTIEIDPSFQASIEFSGLMIRVLEMALKLRVQGFGLELNAVRWLDHNCVYTVDRNSLGLSNPKS